MVAVILISELIQGIPRVKGGHKVVRAAGIQGYEDIGHDAAAAVYGPVLLQRVITRGIGGMGAVCRYHLPVVITLHNVLVIGFCAVAVGTLDAPSRRDVITGYRKA